MTSLLVFVTLSLLGSVLVLALITFDTEPYEGNDPEF